MGHGALPASFQIRPEGVNEIVSRLGLVPHRFGFRIKDMKTNVPIDHLSHECVHSASASRNVMQYLGTLGLLVERPFDGIHLASDTAYAVEQFLFLF